MKEEMVLGELVSQVLTQALGEEVYEDLEKMRRLSKAWKSLVGEEASKRTRPLMLRGGRLIVGAASPAWCNELSVRRDEVKRAVQERLGIELKEVVVRTKI